MEFFDLLVRYEVRLWNALELDLGRHDQLTLSQLHALRVVERFGGQARVQELSQEIGVTVGAASKLVDRLERDGWVLRISNPTDRRSSLIGLTTAGQRALADSTDVFARAMARAVGDEDLQPLITALSRLQSRLDTTSTGVAA